MTSRLQRIIAVMPSTAHWPIRASVFMKVCRAPGPVLSIVPNTAPVTTRCSTLIRTPDHETAERYHAARALLHAKRDAHLPMVRAAHRIQPRAGHLPAAGEWRDGLRGGVRRHTKRGAQHRYPVLGFPAVDVFQTGQRRGGFAVDR